jgi:hypothetical protein
MGGAAIRFNYMLYELFGADLGERRSTGRPGAIRPSSILCKSQRRFLSISGRVLQKRLPTRIGQLPKKRWAHGCCVKGAVCWNGRDSGNTG